MNRRMTCAVGEDETPTDLADELVHYGLICEVNICLFYEPFNAWLRLKYHAYLNSMTCMYDLLVDNRR